MIRTIFSVCLLLVVLLWQGCSPFANRYERIEQERIRALSMVFSPLPEGAPGDTVRVRLHCTGDSASVASWQMSYDVVVDDYGSVVAKNPFSLPIIKSTSYYPDSFDVEFVIPDSTFYKSATIAQALERSRGLLPESLRSLSQDKAAALMEDFVNLDPTDATSFVTFVNRWQTTIGTSNADSLLLVAGLLNSAFSIKTYVYANLQTETGKKLVARSELAVRYNRRLWSNPLLAGLVSVNNNPLLRWLGIYQVKGRPATFDPGTADPEHPYVLHYLKNEFDHSAIVDTITIDTGYSYYVAADSGIVHIATGSASSADAPYVLKDSSTIYLKSPSIRLGYTLPKGDTVRIPAIMKEPGIVRVFVNFGDKKRVIVSVKNSGDTLVAHNADGSIRIDTSITVRGNVTSPLWYTIERASVDLFALTRDLGVSFTGSVGAEEYLYYWFYENTDAGFTTRPLDSLMAIVPSGTAIAPLLPSQDEQMHQGHLWVAVGDYYAGEVNRPTGYTQLGANVYFKYTPAYIEAMKNE